MSQKWNLQDIRPAEPRKRRRPPVERQQRPQQQSEDTTSEAPRSEPEYRNREEIPNIVVEDGRKKSNKKLYAAIGAFVFVIGIALLLSAILGKTVLTINPQQRTPNVSAEYTAYPEQRDEALSYEIMTLEATQESQVAASGQVEVEELATGVMEIVKTTPGAERLIKNTRFRSPNGLVFRTEESVVVPGAVDGVPGTIQVDVFADDVGESYNLEAGTEFDIPGFEEGGFTELYESISGRNPQQFTGGFAGPQFQIDDDELATARQALQMELRDNLLARIATEKPADFIAFPGAVAITYNQLPAKEYGDDLVTIKEQAILQIPLFRSGDLASFLANETIPTYEGNPVRIQDPTVLSFSYSSATTSSSVIANEPSLTFNLSGKPQLVWEYDVVALKRDLAGLPKTALANIPNAYPGIQKASVQITPFWRQSFPEDTEAIEVVEVLDTEE